MAEIKQKSSIAASQSWSVQKQNSWIKRSENNNGIDKTKEQYSCISIVVTSKTE